VTGRSAWALLFFEGEPRSGRTIIVYREASVDSGAGVLAASSFASLAGGSGGPYPARARAAVTAPGPDGMVRVGACLRTGSGSNAHVAAGAKECVSTQDVLRRYSLHSQLALSVWKVYSKASPRKEASSSLHPVGGLQRGFHPPAGGLTAF